VTTEVDVSLDFVFGLAEQLIDGVLSRHMIFHCANQKLWLCELQKLSSGMWCSTLRFVDKDGSLMYLRSPVWLEKQSIWQAKML